MPVMRSVFYTPSNNEKMVAKAPEIACDILTLDLEDSVPPAEKQKGREMIQEYFKSGRDKQLSPTLFVRVNNWETQMTNDDLEAIVHPGLDGVCLAKCGDAENVKRLDWKLEELEQRRGMQVGSVGIQLLIETAKGVMNAYPAACASPRVNSLIFGAVDFTRICASPSPLKSKSSCTPATTRRLPPERPAASPLIVPLSTSVTRRVLRRAPGKAGRWAMKAGC